MDEARRRGGKVVVGGGGVEDTKRKEEGNAGGKGLCLRDKRIWAERYWKKCAL